MKTTLSIVLCVLFTPAFSQKVSSLRIASESDTIRFVLKIDELAVNTTPLSELRINQCPSGRVILSIKLQNDLSVSELPLYLEKGVENSFTMGIRGKEIYLTPLSTVSLETKLKELPVHAEFRYNQLGITTDEIHEKTEGIGVDSTGIEFSYSGKKGCEKLSSKKELNQFIELLSQENFSSRKTTITQRFLSENCLTVANLRLILESFAFEDHRLEIIAQSTSAVFDVDNYFRLADLFVLKPNQQKFDSWLENNAYGKK